MMERKTARIIALDLLAACRRDRSWSDGYLKAAIRKNGLDSRDAALTTRLAASSRAIWNRLCWMSCGWVHIKFGLWSGCRTAPQ